MQSTKNHPSEIDTYSDCSNSMNNFLPDVSNGPNMSIENSSNQIRISPISILNPYTNNWTICARVTTKHPIRKWSNSKGEGQVLSFELTDSSSIIKVTAFNEFATEYDRRIFLNKVMSFYFIISSLHIVLLRVGFSLLVSLRVAIIGAIFEFYIKHFVNTLVDSELLSADKSICAPQNFNY